MFTLSPWRHIEVLKIWISILSIKRNKIFSIIL